MAAAYDNYDYPSYWAGRDYEHESELIALKNLLGEIPEIGRLIDLGAGFGRLTPSYAHRAEKIYLVDPSASLLSQARENLKDYKNVKYIQSSLENLKGKVKPNSFDLALIIRVLHHIDDLDHALKNINNLLKPGGYVIIEFANKLHVKELFKNLFKGNLTYPLDIFPRDRRSRKNKLSTLPFLNFHPDVVRDKLKKSGFEIIKSKSVSNVRSSFAKRHFPVNFLLLIEEWVQNIFSKLNFGPSIFILAQKSK